MARDKRKIILFGLGTDMKKFMKEYECFLMDRLQIIACTDNNFSQKFENGWVKFIVPEEIPKEKDYIVLISTRKYYKEIYYQLTHDLMIDERNIMDLDAAILPAYKELYKKNANKCLFVIGDSHTFFFAGKERHVYRDKHDIGFGRPSLGAFIPIHLGPVLAHSLNRYGTRTQGREKIDFLLNEEEMLPHGSKILCCFGEIDMRVHILKEAEKRGVPYLHDEEYRTRHEYYEDLVHLSQTAWQFAKDEFLKFGITVYPDA